MNDWKCAITLAICSGIVLTIAASASADFVGVTTVIKDDPDTESLCTQGNGDFVPGPLTVCNVLAIFDNPDDVLLSVGNADLQVYNGANPDVFFHHPYDYSVYDPACADILEYPDLICDTFITIGWKCSPDPTFENPYPDAITYDGSFSVFTFEFTGRIVGGWHLGAPLNGQGDAGTWPDLQVLFLQSSVAQGLSLSGDIDLFWVETYLEGDTVAEVDVAIECAVVCPDDYPCDDGDACTENDVCSNQVCQGTPIDCDDADDCTDDFCDPASGQCVHVSLPDGTPCDDGDACTYDDYCDYGVCYGYAVGCTDNDDCTIDYCDPATGCVNEPIDCDDDDDCSIDSCDSERGCVYTYVECDDGDPCTDDVCEFDAGGCVAYPIECPEGQVCEPASGECVEEQDPCACDDGRVTLCHIPPGNSAKARTITVGCAARDRHLAHGDTCGPCEDAAARNEAKEKSANSGDAHHRCEHSSNQCSVPPPICLAEREFGISIELRPVAEIQYNGCDPVEREPDVVGSASTFPKLYPFRKESNVPLHTQPWFLEAGRNFDS